MSYKPRPVCIIVILAATFMLFFQTSFSQENWSDLDGTLKANQKQLGTNVVMMLWKKGDTLVFKKELGDYNSKTPAPIGAASRWLTAALVMQFVDEGKLSLDDKVNQWIPEFARYGKNYITIRYCLANMTGLDDEEKFFKNPFQKSKFSSLEDEVNSYAAKKIRANPSEDFWYGNVGMNIVGRVLEVVSKKRFDVLIKQKLFNPLTMRRSSFTTLDGSGVSPASGGQTTPDDYMKFLVMLMNNGTYGGKKILSEASVQQLMEIQAKPELFKFAPKEAKRFSYALASWVIEEKDGKANALASYGPTGTWTVLDLCRGYAYLIISKEPLDETKPDLYLRLKGLVDEQFTSTCP